MNRMKLNLLWASAGTTTDPDLDARHPNGLGGAGRYASGWYSGKEPHQWENFLYKNRDDTLLNLMQDNFLVTGSDIGYKKLAMSTGDAPTTASFTYLWTGTAWAKSVQHLSFAEYTGQIAAVNKSSHDHAADKNNPHGLTTVQAGTNTKAESDAKVATQQTLVTSHVSKLGVNAHNLTVAQLSILPVAGGTFTGPVTYQGDIRFTSIPTTNKTVLAGAYDSDRESVPAVGLGETAIAKSGGFYAGDNPSWGIGASRPRRLIQDRMYLPIAGELNRLVTWGSPLFEIEFQNGWHGRFSGEKYTIEGEANRNAQGLVVATGVSLTIPNLLTMKAAGCRVVIGVIPNLGTEVAARLEASTTFDNIIRSNQINVGDTLVWVKIYPPLNDSMYNQAQELSETLHNGSINR